MIILTINRFEYYQTQSILFIFKYWRFNYSNQVTKQFNRKRNKHMSKMRDVEQIYLFLYCNENPKYDESQVADIVEKQLICCLEQRNTDDSRPIVKKISALYKFLSSEKRQNLCNKRNKSLDSHSLLLLTIFHYPRDIYYVDWYPGIIPIVQQEML